MKSGSPRRVPFAALALLAAAALASASAARADTWTTYAHPNDLIDIAAADGVLWMATTGGALRYDPGSGAFRQFGRRLSGGPPSQDLTGVCRDDSGLIYFGSADRGVVTYDPSTERWRRFEEIPSNAIRSVSCLGGDIYIATAAGFAISRTGTEICNDIDRGCCGNDPLNCSFPSFDVRDFGLAGATVWAATAAGPAAFEDGQWRPRPTGLADTDIRTIETHFGDVFAATPNPAGVHRWNDAGALWTAAAGGLRPAQPLGDRVRLVSSGGDLYLCCSYGLFRWDGAAWAGTGLVDVNVRSVVAGDGDVLYAATSTGLWARGAGGTWTHLPASGPPLAIPGQSVTADRNGVIWVGTFGGAMRLDTDGTWTAFRNGQTGIAPSDIYSLFSDSMNRLWLGKCCCPDPSGCPTQFLDDGSASDFLPSLNGWSMHEDRSGRLWIGSNTNGVYALAADGAQVVNLTQASTGGALRSNSVRAVAADGNRIWIGHENAGLQLLDTGGSPANPAAFTWTPSRQLPEPSVIDIALEGSDAWVLTSANLSRYREDIKFEQHALSAGGTPRIGRAVAVDRRGNRWVATSDGALRLGRDGEFAVYSTTNSDIIDDDLYDVAVDPATGDILFQARGGTSRLRPGAAGGGSSGAELFLYPNPFRAGGSGTVKIGGGTVDNALVTDLAGRPVARFAAADGWNGRDEAGQPVAPGLYLVVADGERVLKLAVLR